MISYTRYLGSKYLNVIYGDPAVHFPWSEVVTQGVGSFMCAAGNDKLPSIVDYVPGEQLA